MQRILSQTFFNRRTDTVAQELLGKYLTVRHATHIRRYLITETEAYDGFRDRASHAHRRKTARNTIMFGHAGYWYVYFTYGIHWLLNVVTRESGYPAAVLIRGVERYPGPARLTRALRIDAQYNGKSVTRVSGLWVTDGGIRIPKTAIQKMPRVGVAYAGPYWARRKWRFVLTRHFPNAPS